MMNHDFGPFPIDSGKTQKSIPDTDAEGDQDRLISSRCSFTKKRTLLVFIFIALGILGATNIILIDPVNLNVDIGGYEPGTDTFSPYFYLSGPNLSRPKNFRSPRKIHINHLDKSKFIKDGYSSKVVVNETEKESKPNYIKLSDWIYDKIFFVDNHSTGGSYNNEKGFWWDFFGDFYNKNDAHSSPSTTHHYAREEGDYFNDGNDKQATEGSPDEVEEGDASPSLWRHSGDLAAELEFVSSEKMLESTYLFANSVFYLLRQVVISQMRLEREAQQMVLSLSSRANDAKPGPSSRWIKKSRGLLNDVARALSSPSRRHSPPGAIAASFATDSCLYSSAFFNGDGKEGRKNLLERHDYSHRRKRPGEYSTVGLFDSFLGSTHREDSLKQVPPPIVFSPTAFFYNSVGAELLKNYKRNYWHNHTHTGWWMGQNYPEYSSIFNIKQQPFFYVSNMKAKSIKRKTMTSASPLKDIDSFISRLLKRGARLGNDESILGVPPENGFVWIVENSLPQALNEAPITIANADRRAYQVYPFPDQDALDISKPFGHWQAVFYKMEDILREQKKRLQKKVKLVGDLDKDGFSHESYPLPVQEGTFRGKEIQLRSPQLLEPAPPLYLLVFVSGLASQGHAISCSGQVATAGGCLWSITDNAILKLLSMRNLFSSSDSLLTEPLVDPNHSNLHHQINSSLLYMLSLYNNNKSSIFYQLRSELFFRYFLHYHDTFLREASNEAANHPDHAPPLFDIAIPFCDNWCSGYYHFTHEHLPRLALVHALLTAPRIDSSTRDPEASKGARSQYSRAVLLLDKRPTSWASDFYFNVLGIPRQAVRVVPQSRGRRMDSVATAAVARARIVVYPMPMRCGNVMSHLLFLLKRLIFKRLRLKTGVSVIDKYQELYILWKKQSANSSLDLMQLNQRVLAKYTHNYFYYNDVGDVSDRFVRVDVRSTTSDGDISYGGFYYRHFLEYMQSNASAIWSKPQIYLPKYQLLLAERNKLSRMPRNYAALLADLMNDHVLSKRLIIADNGATRGNRQHEAFSKGSNISFTGQMTVTKQIQLFYSSDIILGPHGANLANIMFSKQGAHVIEVGSYQDGNMCYYSTAGRAGLHHHYLAHRASKGGQYTLDYATQLRQHIWLAIQYLDKAFLDRLVTPENP